MSIREIIRAAKRGDASVAAELLDLDPELARATEEDGTTPLHCAAWKGHVAVAALLLQAGADVNAESRDTHYGGTPLHAAAHGNQKAVAEVLIAAGALLDIRSCNDRTPLDETTIHQARAVAKLLREHGAAE